MDELIRSLYIKMNNIDFSAYGILDSNNKIHTLGTDSKIIGRIFEMFTQPCIEEYAKENGLLFKTPESQTVYPDFVLMRKESDNHKIAIDIKTTYVDNSYSHIKFTLGSYGSYMRNNTKNIAYPYTDFSKHYVIGFIYERDGEAQESKLVEYEHREKITCPFKNVRYFVQEKYKIAGDKPGSGNTENIGSIVSNNLDDFIKGNGPFSKLGQDIYDLYWSYYPQYRSPSKNYISLEEFLKWFPKQPPLELVHEYDYKEVKENVERYMASQDL